jgi:class 3 adenylate cyclase
MTPSSIAIPMPPSGERRVLTVMFADLVDSTKLAEHLDPEDFLRVLHISRGICSDAIHRYGGNVAKYMGDGILACFGHPRVTEQSAQRAVNAGFEMVEGHKHAAWDLPAGTPRPALRVGLHTGLVVIADITTPDGDTEHDAIIGAASNVASRVHGEAPPDGLVVSEETLRETAGRFVSTSLGARNLKGVEKAVVVHQITARLAAAASPERTDYVLHLPMVGRREEMETLSRHWQEARETGSTPAFLITGEAGMGKSRLVAEFLRQREARDHSLEFFLPCSAYHTNTSFYPVRRCISAMLGLEESDRNTGEKLRQCLSEAGITKEDAALLAAIVFGFLEEMPAHLMGLSSDVRKARTFTALNKLVQGLAAGCPAVMIFNDIHWSDELTHEWLSLLCEDGLKRVLLLATMRPEEATFPAKIEILPLKPLGLDDVRELISHVASGKVMPREIAVQITRRTRGVALYVVEMTRALLASGMMQEFDTHFASRPGTPLADCAAVPLTLQELLLKRVQSAGPAREMMQLCAVLGEDFPEELPCKLWAINGREDGNEQLGKLIQAELLESQNGRLAFHHALLRSVAYDATLKSQRVHWHRVVARHLESSKDQALAVEPAMVAHHYRLAGMPQEAAVFSLRAAHACIARSAYSDAVAQALQGLGLIEDREDGKQEARLVGIQLATVLGLASMTTLGYSAPEVEDAFGRAEALCLPSDAAEVRFPVQWGHWVVALMKAKLDEAERRATAMIEIGESSGSDHFLIEGLWTCGVALFYRGRIVESRNLLERAVAMYRPEHARNAFIHGQDPGVAARTYLTFVLCFQGHVREAEAMAAEGLELARKLGHAHTLTWALGGCTMLRLGLGDLPGTLRFGQEAMTECMEQEHSWWLCAIKMMVAWATTHAEDPVRGLRILREAFSVYEGRLGTILVQPIFCAMLADASARNGLFEEAQQWSDRGIQMAEHNAELLNLPGVLLIAGQLKMVGHTPDPAGAEQLFRRALEISRQQGATLRELQAASALAQLLVARGEGAEALAMLKPLADWFEQEEGLPLAAAAKQFVGMLAQQPAPAGH